MSTSQAAIIQPASKRRLRKSISSAPAQLRIGQRPKGNRMQRLVELAFTLFREAETLALDKAFGEETENLQRLEAAGVDFYGEVQRFESALIKLALGQTGGHQARAAKLLHIKPTTLNSKIKLYNIEY